MFSSPVLAVALAGAAIAFTPPGFTPSSSQNLTVAFGNTLAVDGKELQKPETANAPTIGTAEKLVGTYAIIMVDPDVPSGPGGSTTELLHWMQAGLVSSNASTTIGGVQAFELVNVNNSTAFATYIQPSPPNKVPHTHRYTQLLLNTTDVNTTSLSSLAKLAMTRTNFDAANAISMSGAVLVAGNSFDVSNGTLVQSNITKTSSSPVGGASATGTGTGSSSTGAANGNGTVGITPTAGATELKSGAALIAGLGALAAAVLML